MDGLGLILGGLLELVIIIVVIVAIVKGVKARNRRREEEEMAAYRRKVAAEDEARRREAAFKAEKARREEETKRREAEDAKRQAKEKMKYIETLKPKFAKNGLILEIIGKETERILEHLRCTDRAPHIRKIEYQYPLINVYADGIGRRGQNAWETMNALAEYDFEKLRYPVLSEDEVMAVKLLIYERVRERVYTYLMQHPIDRDENARVEVEAYVDSNGKPYFDANEQPRWCIKYTAYNGYYEEQKSW